MRDYGKVSPRFWTSGSGRRLRGDPDAQVLALYLMSCPASTMSGIFTLAVPTMAHETGLTEKRVREALDRLGAENMVQFDETCDLVWVVNMLRHQVGEVLDARDKRVTALARELAPYRGHHFVKALRRGSEGAYCLPEILEMPLPRGFEGALGASDRANGHGHVQEITHTKPLRSQEQEQEQEQDQEQGQDQEHTSGASARDLSGPGPDEGVLVPARPTEASQLGAVVEHYRQRHPRSFPKGLRMHMAEAKLIKRRLAEGFTVEDLKQAIDGYHVDPWHLGVNDRNKPFLDLELIVRDAKHVQKGLELHQRGPPPGLSQREKEGVWASESWLAKRSSGET